eukprot:SAG31_NODE_2267_length_6052_cov_7.222241_1_plen_46_part_00
MDPVPRHGLFAALCDGVEHEEECGPRSSWLRIARNTDLQVLYTLL